MAQVVVTEAYLSDIAQALRVKLGTNETFKPSQMGNGVRRLPTAPRVITKSITANGTQNASGDNADGYSSVIANVPNTYAASDEGKVVNNGALVSQSSQTITQNGTYNTTLNNQIVANVPNTYTSGDEGKVVDNGALVAQTSKNIGTNGTHDTTKNNSVVVNVPNSYSASDEGKVVNSGALVAQTSQNITQNGTYDTTLKNEVVVNVSGGGGNIAILLDEHEYKDTSGGSFTYEKTVTIPKNSRYSIAVISYSNAPTIKINNVSQSYSFYSANDYIYYYTSELALSVGDEISISVTNSGKSAAYAQIIDLDAGGGESTIIESWDLTDSLIGTQREWILETGNVVLGNNGAIFDSTNDYLKLTDWRIVPITIELDIVSMSLQSGTHRRFVMADDSRGFIYRSNGTWAFYSNTWEESSITDGNYFNNCKLKIVIDASGYWHIYKNDVLVWEPSLVLKPTSIILGSSATSINNAIISAMRIY